MKRNTTYLYILLIALIIVGVILNLLDVSWVAQANTVIGAIELLIVLRLLQSWRRRDK